jgi:hypothetical protein
VFDLKKQGMGRRSMAQVLSATLLACAAALPGQSGGSDGEPLGALRHGPLVVWFLEASTKPPQSNLNAIADLHRATPLNYSEKSTGTFGQNASTYGQNASTYGVDADSRTISTPQSAPGADAPTAKQNGIGYKEQAASTFGQNAAGYGTAASNNGQAASTAGQNAGSYGTEASRYGTAASNVGLNASNFGDGNSGETNANNAQTPEANPNAEALEQPLSSPVAEQVKENLRQAFPDLQMKFIAVDPDQLKSRLVATRGSADFPDVLLGTLPPGWWNGIGAQFGLTMLRPAVFYPNGVTDHFEGEPEVAILKGAPHMQAAREFALWIGEPSSGCPGCVQSGLAGTEAAAAATAKSAMERVLNGQPLGDEADPVLVMDSSRAVRRMLATMGNTEATNDGVSVQVARASVNGSLAAVGLRVVVSSANVFGVAHPLVVLRTGKDGKWRVLQMSLNMPQHEQVNERQALMVSNPPTAAEQGSGVKGIAQASPQDGQSLSQMPQLVWDNRGGAGLQVVEWQRGEGGAWSDARLYLVEDRSPTLRTQVDAEFADANGRYRWRVWSVGTHGAVEISPWRTFVLTR